MTPKGSTLVVDNLNNGGAVPPLKEVAKWIAGTWKSCAN